jgi:hypothetical protein
MRKSGGMSVNIQKKVRISETSDMRRGPSIGPPAAARMPASCPQLSDLNSEDKTKISKLVERVLELGRENDTLVTQLQEAGRRRGDDVMVAVGVIRSELQQKHDEVAALQAKRLGALQLLRRYQDKVSELADSVRGLQRGDAERKAQLAGYKAELNNLQQLLETQSQTIQSYRMQVSSAASKDAGQVELEDALRRRGSELKASQSRTLELEESSQQLQEQLSALRGVIHDKDKQIVDLNAQVLKQSVESISMVKSPKRENNTAKTTAAAGGGASSADYINKKVSSVTTGAPPSTGRESKVSRSDSMIPPIYNASRQETRSFTTQSSDFSSNWGADLQDEDFISHLERLAQEKKLKKLEKANREAVVDDGTYDELLAPPPVRAPSPPSPREAEGVEGEGERDFSYGDAKRDNGKVDPVWFDDRFGDDIIEDDIAEPSVLPVADSSRLKRSSSPVGLSRKTNNKRNAASVEPSPSVAKGGRKAKPTSLSSSASTLMNTMTKPTSKQASRTSYTSSAENNHHKSVSNSNYGTEKRIKFGARSSTSGEGSAQASSDFHSKANKSNAQKSSNSRNSIKVKDNSQDAHQSYDPRLFDMLDEMDSAHDTSTISSISRNYQDANHW